LFDARSTSFRATGELTVPRKAHAGVCRRSDGFGRHETTDARQHRTTISVNYSCRLSSICLVGHRSPKVGRPDDLAVQCQSRLAAYPLDARSSPLPNRRLKGQTRGHIRRRRLRTEEASSSIAVASAERPLQSQLRSSSVRDSPLNARWAASSRAWAPSGHPKCLSHFGFTSACHINKILLSGLIRTPQWPRSMNTASRIYRYRSSSNMSARPSIPPCRQA